MFLSKIFGIFKRKKDNPQGDTGKPAGTPAVTPSSDTAAGGIGTTLGQPGSGIDQPSQPVIEPTFNPGNATGDVSQASSNDIPTQSSPVSEPVESVDSLNPNGGIADANQPADTIQPTDDNDSQTISPGDSLNVDSPSVGTDVSPPPAEDSGIPSSSGDDSQNSAV